MATAATDHRPLGREDAGLADLRREALRLMLVVVSCLAFVQLFAAGALIGGLEERPAYPALALALLVAACYGLVGRSVRLASALLVVGLVAVVGLCVLLFPPLPLAAAAVLPVLAAVALLGPGAGVATLLAGGAALVGAAVLGRGTPLVDAAAVVVGLGGLVLSAAGVLLRPGYLALDWALVHYAESERRLAELRERQAEVGRLNHSLDLAYDRLREIAGQLERARQAADEARRLKAEFAASVSHELRTPVNVVIGLSELMVAQRADAPALPEPHRADVEAVLRNARHISNLIDDVLDLSQVEAHRMGLSRDWTSLRAVVDEAAAAVEPLFEHTGLALDVRLPDDLPPIYVDAVRIRQILINLLNNAVRFTEEGGVVVEARAEGEQLVVSVADTGVGIPAAELPAVFQDFWRLGEPTRGRRGSGLGLAISKRFAELHGGNMWATSEPGRGSTFFLALPLGTKEVVQVAELDGALWERMADGAPRPSVLLVDAHADSRRVFRRYLDGYDVEAVPSVGAAMARLRRKAPSALLVDRPERAAEAIDALAKAGAARVPVITCGLRTSRVMARELDVSDYLVKPVSQQQVERALRRFGPPPADVVIVDDDPEMLHLLARMIAAVAPGGRVRTASDGWQALDLLWAHRPAGLLLDLLMPGLDGYGLLERVRHDPGLADLPVVAITARGATDDALVADALAVTRPGGLPVGELAHWIKAGLDAPRRVDAAAAPASRGARRGSPASTGSR